jgi:hypothetical protein
MTGAGKAFSSDAGEPAARCCRSVEEFDITLSATASASFS